MKQESRARAGVVCGVVTALLLTHFTPHAAASDDERRAAGEARAGEAPGVQRSGIASRGESPDAAGGAPIVLEPGARALAGIVSVVPEPVTVKPQIGAPGEVVDLAPLVADYQRVAGARAVLAARRETAHVLEARLLRLRGLGRDGEIVAARERAALEVSWRTERERVAAAQAELERVTAALNVRWGRAVGEALRGGDELMSAVLAGDALLVMFAMPPGAPAPAPGESVSVLATFDGSPVTAAAVIGPAAAAFGHAPGTTHYARTAAGALRAGMRVTVRLAGSEAPLEGVWLPPGAVVWHAGARWYFVEVAPNTFARLRVPDAREHDSGFVLDTPPAARGPVVVRGAQALLAEAFRAQIPEEDED